MQGPRAPSVEICKTIPNSSSWLVFLYSLGGLRLLQKMRANRDLTTWLGLLRKVKWETVAISGQRSVASHCFSVWVTLRVGTEAGFLADAYRRDPNSVADR